LLEEYDSYHFSSSHKKTLAKENNAKEAIISPENKMHEICQTCASGFIESASKEDYNRELSF
jgi:hypothetical protein